MSGQAAAALHSVGDALHTARALGLTRLDAQLLVAHALGRDRAWVLAHDDAALQGRDAAALQITLAERARGVPLAYLTGTREFRGLPLGVSTAVLVPRPETEALVDWGLNLLEAHRAAWPAPSVADLGTGSGAIALALKSAWPAARVTATDASAAALAVAEANAQRLGLDITFAAGSWFEPLEGSRLQLILSNPPYIAGDDEHLAALCHEPRAALTPGRDGLAALRHLASGAGAYLVAGGWLLLEHGHDQGEAVAVLLRDAGFETVETRRDLADHARHSGGRWPG